MSRSIRESNELRLMVIERGYPYKYEKMLEEESNREFGEELVGNPKSGGLRVSCAITEIDDVPIEIGEYVDRKDLFIDVIVPTPVQFKERGYNLLNERRGMLVEGGKVVIKDNGVVITDIYANPTEEVLWEDGKVVKKFSEIKEFEIPEKKYKALKEKEELRKKVEKEVFELWDKMNDDEAWEYLLEVFSRRFTLRRGEELVKPDVGIEFYGKIKYSKNGKFRNLIGYKWDDKEYDWDVYNYKPIDILKSEDIKKAEEIKNCKLICFG